MGSHDIDQVNLFCSRIATSVIPNPLLFFTPITVVFLISCFFKCVEKEFIFSAYFIFLDSK